MTVKDENQTQWIYTENKQNQNLALAENVLSACTSSLAFSLGISADGGHLLLAFLHAPEIILLLSYFLSSHFIP